MEINTITIGGHEKTPYVFNINSLKAFSKEVGIKGPSGVEEFFRSINKTDISFDDIDAMAVLTISAMKEGCRLSESEYPNIEMEDVLLEIEKNPEIISLMMSDYIASAGVDTGDEKKEGTK